MAYIGKTPTVGNFQVCDAISVVNGQAAYTLQVGGTNVAPESANHMLVSLNGILQKPGSSFTISGSTMTFASNLATGDVIDFVQILGNVLDLGVPSDATVTTAKLGDNAVSSAKMFSGFANGITEADMFRLTADQSGGTNADITANLERVDDATFSKIGTGMTESSGIFTFPSTGLYQVICNPMFRSNSDANSFLIINVSSNSGSAYDSVGYANGGNGASSDNTTSVFVSSFVNVTNASNFRVKFTTSSMGANSFLSGNTDSNYTNFVFIRLGDSQ